MEIAEYVHPYSTRRSPLDGLLHSYILRHLIVFACRVLILRRERHAEVVRNGLSRLDMLTKFAALPDHTARWSERLVRHLVRPQADFNALPGAIGTKRISTRCFKAAAMRFSMAREWPS